MAEQATSLLDAARRLGTFTKTTLAAESGQDYSRAKYWVRRMEERGEVRRVATERQQRVTYELVPTKPAATCAPRREESPHQNMWTAMRALTSFSARDLAAHASTETVQVTESAADAYCRLLSRASYVRALRKAVPGGRLAIYRLVRNTGPLPPVERRITVIFDNNLHQVVSGLPT